jgi:hypothetical protein
MDTVEDPPEDKFLPASSFPDSQNPAMLRRSKKSPAFASLK